jgi:flagellar biosynthesis GTPase FlhF
MNIEKVERAGVDESAIKNLQIPPERLEMIKALAHKLDGERKAWTADHIQNKGEGQIFLLHGPSGVGKTYTAECIAELTGADDSCDTNALLTLQRTSTSFSHMRRHR